MISAVRRGVLAGVVLAVALAGVAFAAFSALSDNPTNSFKAADSFCTAPGMQSVAASQDAWVQNGGGGSGTSATLNVATPTVVLGARRTLVKFDLPPIPSRCTLKSATLRLHATSSSGSRTIEVLRVNTGWTEAGATFSTTNSTIGPAASSASLSAAGVQSWNVLAQIQAIYAGSNNGFVVRDSADGLDILSSQQVYQAREGTNNSQDPELRLSFG